MTSGDQLQNSVSFHARGSRMMGALLFYITVTDIVTFLTRFNK